MHSGTTGPYRDRPAHDLAVEAVAGLLEHDAWRRRAAGSARYSDCRHHGGAAWAQWRADGVAQTAADGHRRLRRGRDARRVGRGAAERSRAGIRGEIVNPSRSRSARPAEPRSIASTTRATASRSRSPVRSRILSSERSRLSVGPTSWRFARGARGSISSPSSSACSILRKQVSGRIRRVACTARCLLRPSQYAARGVARIRTLRRASSAHRTSKAGGILRRRFGLRRSPRGPCCANRCSASIRMSCSRSSRPTTAFGDGRVHPRR